MNRIQEIRQAAGPFLTELLERRMEKAERSYERQSRIWEKIFREQLEGLVEQKQESTANLVISWLNSSIITDSHVYQIAWYDEEIYVEPHPVCIYYTPEFLFEGIWEDIDRIKEFLEDHFVRVMEYETQEIRRDYMKMLYPEGKEFFRQMMPKNGNYDFQVWFGEYMKSTDAISGI